MSLIVNYNGAAMNAHRNLVATDKQLQTSIQHLSSGLRVVLCVGESESEREAVPEARFQGLIAAQEGAGELQQAAATGNYSSSTLDEAARCLAALAR